MKLSVIIPVFNGAAHIEHALTSVAAQTRLADEVIVVDDGSTDSTAEVIKKFNVSCIQQTNQGPAAARNAGIVESTGDLIAFLDADDYWQTDKLKLQENCLQKKPGTALVVCRMTPALQSGEVWPRHLNRKYYESCPMAYVPSGLMVRRKVFEKIGYFNTDIWLGEDSDWLMRLRDANLEIAELDCILVTKMIRAGSLSSNPGLAQRTLLKQLRDSVKRKRGQNEPGESA